MSSKGGPEKRRFARIPVALSIHFRKLEEFQDFVQGDALDLSRGGVFIRTDRPRPVGTMVLMQIPTPGGQTVQLRGNVRHIKYSSGTTGDPVGMGIEFAYSSERERKFVQSLLDMHNP